MSDHTPHILVVDDHREIRDAVTRYLEKNGLRAQSAKSAADMDVALQAGRFDLIILGVMMPREDGLSAARRLAAAGGPPVLMLSAFVDDTDRIVGLEVGADDYLVKPFNPRELLARVKAILRRSARHEPLAGKLGGRKLAFAGWLLDTDTRALTHEDGREAALTTAEFNLLTAFLERPRFVLSRDQLLDITIGRTAEVFDRTIDNQVRRLRRKIKEDPAPARIIAPIRAGGYSLAHSTRCRRWWSQLWPMRAASRQTNRWNGPILRHLHAIFRWNCPKRAPQFVSMQRRLFWPRFAGLRCAAPCAI